MRRSSFKTDSSFFEKIAIGAVGARAVSDDLLECGHVFHELERGATDTKLWKDVKRKRVRIPDLVCIRCGTRIECRAKSDDNLAMSHSTSDAERSWDYGMVDDDIIAFPVCSATDDKSETIGRLTEDTSYWRERRWKRWNIREKVNYFYTRSFRSVPHDEQAQKGVTEGTETSIIWSAIFVSDNGIVESVIENRKIKVRLETGRPYTWQNRHNLPVVVQPGAIVKKGQVLAAKVQPLDTPQLTCSSILPNGHILRLINSRERTQRFTGIKLARLRNEDVFVNQGLALENDPEEDPYVRMEAASYLASVCGQSARELFAPYLEHQDDQIRLEAVIAMSEVATMESTEILSELLHNVNNPFFLRSASAWALSRIGNDVAIQQLMVAFSDIECSIRKEALADLISVGDLAIPRLLDGLAQDNPDIAAGCAEVIRQQGNIDVKMAARLVDDALVSDHPWIIWLLGNMKREDIFPMIAEYQESRPELHYALLVLWSFTESWISKQWEPQTLSYFPGEEMR